MQDELRLVHDGTVQLGKRMQLRDQMLDSLPSIAELSQQVSSGIGQSPVALHFIGAETSSFAHTFASRFMIKN